MVQVPWPSQSGVESRVDPRGNFPGRARSKSRSYLTREGTMARAMWIALLLVTEIVLNGTKAAEARQPGAGDQAAIVNGNNQFALDLYGRVRIRDGNVFYSGF